MVKTTAMLRERINVKMALMSWAPGAVAGVEDHEEAMDTVEATKMATMAQVQKRGRENALSAVPQMATDLCAIQVSGLQPAMTYLTLAARPAARHPDVETQVH